ncbi:hypothetical protein EOPP23_13920 [Endozoicomonas sp. OPT23]|uniref:hypothetical protein n=1 Tax=Endozoicomonas sp. OPT23 TaxID=2072845 RepID=UPI00129AD264|nr:hypothetical protein [Endozoicomonas sp. OPT23]MRI34088.1 hypothetical protein [Endozoicomonas sp. OPT23]
MFIKRLIPALALLNCMTMPVFADSVPDMDKVEALVKDSANEVGCYHYFAVTRQTQKQKKYQGILKLSGLLHKMDATETNFAIGYGVGKIEYSLADKPQLRKAVFKKLARSCK